MAKARTAEETRKIQFADIDELLLDLGEFVDELKERAAGQDPTSWGYTGRGGDLARLQRDLRTALCIDDDEILPGCDQ